MKLDRYNGEQPKFLVFRRLDTGRAVPDGAMAVRGRDGGTYIEVDPWDCLVLKRQDVNSPSAVFAYAQNADAMGDFELAQDMTRLAVEWTATPGKKNPD